MYVATKLFLTKGVGQHKEKLVSFELALRNAQLASFNIVRVSSIFPPHCEIVSLRRGLKELSHGQIIHTVMADTSTNENHRLIGSSVGIAIPRDRSHIGYLSEHHSYGDDDRTTGDYAEDIAAQMLATILGVDFDVNQSYNKRLDQWKLSDQIVKTSNITQTAVGKAGYWITVVAAAVLIP
ncbi:MAG: arginine decarboxylase, pyruvoyl-dependent [Alphaproteobacteria bacterium]|uniref:Pyruvoyl-dependent arginine decarboxylase AaxB n=1 Tax=Candidatus Nitrobium versatile TaxID=2884831 RepID=A0A953M349_9BACT|nr:arginine decarboxylase, pyruvoyl-dependent [Candidatus Nitrobium versatile]